MQNTSIIRVSLLRRKEHRFIRFVLFRILTPILLTWRIWWAPNNASRWDLIRCYKRLIFSIFSIFHSVSAWHNTVLREANHRQTLPVNSPHGIATTAQVDTVKPRITNNSDYEQIYRTQSVSDNVLCLELRTRKPSKRRQKRITLDNFLVRQRPSGSEAESSWCQET